MIKIFLLKTVPLFCSLFLFISLASFAAGEPGAGKNPKATVTPLQKCLVKLVVGNTSVTVTSDNCSEVSRIVTNISSFIGSPEISPLERVGMNPYELLPL